MNKVNLLIILIMVILVILFLFLIVYPKIVLKCIGRNSEFYTQLGCNLCDTQLNELGKNQKEIKIINCWNQGDKCNDINYTPAWKIKGIKYEGFFNIKELKEMTGCGLF